MPPAPPSYDQATGTQRATATTTYSGQVMGQPMGQANQAPQPTYHQQYVSSSTCVYTPAQTVPPPQTATIITQQPVVFLQSAQVLPLGPEPVFITCPHCNVQKMTRLHYEPSARTHLMAALFCLLGLWCCVCLPYCAGSCMNASHYCGNCNKFLGTYGGGI